MWEKVAKTVGKYAPLAGSLLLGERGNAVGTMLASVLGVEDRPDAVEAALAQDPEAAAKLRQMEMDHKERLLAMKLEDETARLAEVNKTMRAEAAANDAYVRRWRPTFGYIVAITWLAQVGGLVYSIVGSPETAAEIINAITALTPMWGIALAVLGVSVHKRSQDKQVSAGQSPATIGGLLGGILQKPQPKEAP